MLLQRVIDRECSGIISICVIYHTLSWYLTSETVNHASLLIAIIVMELSLVFIVSRPHNSRHHTDQFYRPHVSHSVMLIFLVPMCAFKDTAFSIVNSDYLDHLWLSAAHMSVIIAKYASLHGKYAFTAYIALAFVSLCLFTQLSSPIYLFFFMTSGSFVWKCIDWIPKAVPKCFSFGEIAIILQLFCGWLDRMVHGIHLQVVFDENLRLKWTAATIVAAVIVATLVLVLSAAYRSLLAFVFIYAVHAGFSVAFLTWKFQENFFVWLIGHLFQDCTGITLLTTWILLIAVTVVWTVSQALVMSSHSKVDPPQNPQYSPVTPSSSFDATQDNQISDGKYVLGDVMPNQGQAAVKVSKSSISYTTRKVFHIFILLVYVPGLLLDPSILFLSSSAALGAFIIFEAVRVLNVPFVGSAVDHILRPFTDERDQGPLFLTHIYLLVGLSLPLWITSSSFSDSSLAVRLYSGVLALGIGDTIACVAGSAFGIHQWPGTKKTIEGTASAIIAQMIFVLVLYSLDLLRVHSFYNIWTGVTATFIVEAFTDQIDNLVLPLVIFPFLCSS